MSSVKLLFISAALLSTTPFLLAQTDQRNQSNHESNITTHVMMDLPTEADEEGLEVFFNGSTRNSAQPARTEITSSSDVPSRNLSTAVDTHSQATRLVIKGDSDTLPLNESNSRFLTREEQDLFMARLHEQIEQEFYNSRLFHYEEADRLWKEVHEAWIKREQAQKLSEVTQQQQQEARAALEREKRFFEALDLSKRSLGRIAYCTRICARALDSLNPPFVNPGAVVRFIANAIEAVNKSMAKKAVKKTTLEEQKISQQAEEATQRFGQAQLAAPELMAAAERAEKNARAEEHNLVITTAQQFRPPSASQRSSDWKTWADFIIQKAALENHWVHNLLYHGIRNPIWAENLASNAWIQKIKAAEAYADDQSTILASKNKQVEEEKATFLQTRKEADVLKAEIDKLQHQLNEIAEDHDRKKAALIEANQELNELSKKGATLEIGNQKSDKQKELSRLQTELGKACDEFDRSNKSYTPQISALRQQQQQHELLAEEQLQAYLYAEKNLLRKMERASLRTQAHKDAWQRIKFLSPTAISEAVAPRFAEIEKESMSFFAEALEFNKSSQIQNLVSLSQTAEASPSDNKIHRLEIVIEEVIEAFDQTTIAVNNRFTPTADEAASRVLMSKMYMDEIVDKFAGSSFEEAASWGLEIVESMVQLVDKVRTQPSLPSLPTSTLVNQIMPSASIDSEESTTLPNQRFLISEETISEIDSCFEKIEEEIRNFLSGALKHNKTLQLQNLIPLSQKDGVPPSDDRIHPLEIVIEEVIKALEQTTIAAKNPFTSIADKAAYRVVMAEDRINKIVKKFSQLPFAEAASWGLEIVQSTVQLVNQISNQPLLPALPTSTLVNIIPSQPSATIALEESVAFQSQRFLASQETTSEIASVITRLNEELLTESQNLVQENQKNGETRIFLVQEAKTLAEEHKTLVLVGKSLQNNDVQIKGITLLQHANEQQQERCIQEALVLKERDEALQQNQEFQQEISFSLAQAITALKKEAAQMSEDFIKEITRLRATYQISQQGGSQLEAQLEAAIGQVEAFALKAEQLSEQEVSFQRENLRLTEQFHQCQEERKAIIEQNQQSITNLQELIKSAQEEDAQKQSATTLSKEKSFNSQRVVEAQEKGVQPKKEEDSNVRPSAVDVEKQVPTIAQVANIPCDQAQVESQTLSTKDRFKSRVENRIEKNKKNGTKKEALEKEKTIPSTEIEDAKKEQEEADNKVIVALSEDLTELSEVAIAEKATQTVESLLDAIEEVNRETRAHSSQERESLIEETKAFGEEISGYLQKEIEAGEDTKKEIVFSYYKASEAYIQSLRSYGRGNEELAKRWTKIARAYEQAIKYRVKAAEAYKKGDINNGHRLGGTATVEDLSNEKTLQNIGAASAEERAAHYFIKEIEASYKTDAEKNLSFPGKEEVCGALQKSMILYSEAAESYLSAAQNYAANISGYQRFGKIACFRGAAATSFQEGIKILKVNLDGQSLTDSVHQRLTDAYNKKSTYYIQCAKAYEAEDEKRAKQFFDWTYFRAAVFQVGAVPSVTRAIANLEKYHKYLTESAKKFSTEKLTILSKIANAYDTASFYCIQSAEAYAENREKEGKNLSNNNTEELSAATAAEKEAKSLEESKNYQEKKEANPPKDKLQKWDEIAAAYEQASKYWNIAAQFCHLNSREDVVNSSSLDLSAKALFFKISANNSNFIASSNRTALCFAGMASSSDELGNLLNKEFNFQQQRVTDSLSLPSEKDKVENQISEMYQKAIDYDKKSIQAYQEGNHSLGEASGPDHRAVWFIKQAIKSLKLIGQSLNTAEMSNGSSLRDELIQAYQAAANYWATGAKASGEQKSYLEYWFAADYASHQAVALKNKKNVLEQIEKAANTGEAAILNNIALAYEIEAHYWQFGARVAANNSYSKARKLIGDTFVASNAVTYTPGAATSLREVVKMLQKMLPFYQQPTQTKEDDHLVTQIIDAYKLAIKYRIESAEAYSKEEVQEGNHFGGVYWGLRDQCPTMPLGVASSTESKANALEKEREFLEKAKNAQNRGDQHALKKNNDIAQAYQKVANNWEAVAQFLIKDDKNQKVINSPKDIELLTEKAKASERSAEALKQLGEEKISDDRNRSQSVKTIVTGYEGAAAYRAQAAASFEQKEYAQSSSFENSAALIEQEAKELEKRVMSQNN